MKRRPRRVTRRLFLQELPPVVIGSSLLALLGCAPAPCSLDSLPLISRADWHAAEPNLDAVSEHGTYDPATNPEGWRIYDKPLNQILNTIVAHHSALPLSDGPREIQQMHMQFKGYADIAYHFVIGDGGQMYRGRDLNVRGAHTGGHNTGTVGIVLMGNFENSVPPDVQVAAFKTLARCLASGYNITYLAGHRDFQPAETVCPGKNLEPLLPTWAGGLGLQFGTAGYKSP